MEKRLIETIMGSKYNRTIKKEETWYIFKLLFHKFI